MATKKTTRKPKTAPRAASKRPVKRKKRPASGWRSHRKLILLVSIAAAVITALALYIFQSSQAANCALNDKLVNPCRPLIGATSASYGKGNWKSHIDYFEKRAGRHIDVVHSYHSPTQTSLNKDELAYVNRADTLLYMNWKPDAYWKQASGGNKTVNGRIDAMADSIKKLGSKKIFLAIYHEPENDISKGGSKCSMYRGDKGTTGDYRAMWKNVRQRFDAKGVKNVVWVMNYMGYSGWDCAVKDLWPGNGLVDWITWDPYTTDKSSFSTDMSRFYNFLEKNTDSSHAFTSKPWGIGEMGYEGTNQTKAYKYYDDMAAAIKNNTFPRLKMYLFFDMNGKDFGGDANWDARIGYAHSKTDAKEQQHFNAMLKTVMSLSTPTSPTTPPKPTPTAPTNSKDTTPPSISVTNPANGSTVSGKVYFTATASDNSRVTAVTLRVDGKWVVTDGSSPYSLVLDTTKFKDGKHDVILRAWDPYENKTDAKTLTLNFKNSGAKDRTPPAITVTNPSNGETVSGNVYFTATASDNSRVTAVTLRVDGKWVVTDGSSPYSLKLDTRKFKNGKHDVILRAWDPYENKADAKTLTLNFRN